MRYPEPLLKLIATLKKFPGVGSKSAERFAFHLLDWPEHELSDMASVLSGIKKNLTFCEECGALCAELPCEMCNLEKRTSDVLCIVGTAKDIFSIEETREYKGLYHVLGALLSPIHNQAPASSTIEHLKQRIKKHNISEVIIALDSTLEGDTTALYLKKQLEPLDIHPTRLALGLPMGSSLDFIDQGTLARALTNRSSY